MPMQNGDTYYSNEWENLHLSVSVLLKSVINTSGTSIVSAEINLLNKIAVIF